MAHMGASSTALAYVEFEYDAEGYDMLEETERRKPQSIDKPVEGKLIISGCAPSGAWWNSGSMASITRWTAPE